MSKLLTIYLLAYNACNAVAWAYILYLTLTTVSAAYASGSDWTAISLATWEAVGEKLKVLQTLAVLEILHAATGMVRSPVGSTVTQNAARMWVLWVATVLCPTSRAQFGFPLMVFSWSLVEVPRYTFYALNVLDAVPSFVFFLRYHLFIVLYPSGFLGTCIYEHGLPAHTLNWILLGEFLCMYNALPYLIETGKYAIQLPNTHNLAVSLYTALHVTMTMYVVGLFVMFGHMMAMRSRAYAKLKLKTA
jgi:very-long-chain (3R)-3-hydroxyacyl-CoA dehydratase